MSQAERREWLDGIRDRVVAGRYEVPTEVVAGAIFEATREALRSFTP